MSDPENVDTSRAVETEDAPRDPIVALVALGQSVWLDYITRTLVRGGGLKRLIDHDGLRGMTSNPTLFQKAIAAGGAYDEQVKELVGQGATARDVFEAVAVRDVRDACDLFRPVYDRTAGVDGYVSIEVSPATARDAAATLAEARRLWRAVDRPNAMIKVPGTAEGAPAVRQLLDEGVNVNVTLLFSLASHERVMDAYIEALEARARRGDALDRVASVASFFVSRVDAAVDALLDERASRPALEPKERERLLALRGKAAVANAKLAYANFRRVFEGERFRALATKGARVQRPLWASTGVKNKAYRDVVYVEQLIGPDTVNTLPLETLEAFADHGRAARTIDRDVGEATSVLADLSAVAIELGAVTDKLEVDGIASFAASYDDLIAGVERKRRALAPDTSSEAARP